MISIEDWTKVVYGLVEKGLAEIQKSRKLRERMSSTRGVSLNEYTIQFDKTDYEMRKRIYEINREKNESQYQCMKVIIEPPSLVSLPFHPPTQSSNSPYGFFTKRSKI